MGWDSQGHLLTSLLRGGPRFLYGDDPRVLGARADPELGAEGAIEVRHVAEAAVERDVQDLPGPAARRVAASRRRARRTYWCGVTPVRRSNVRRKWYGLRRAARARAPRVRRLVRVALDQPHRSRHARDGARRRDRRHPARSRRPPAPCVPRAGRRAPPRPATDPARPAQARAIRRRQARSGGRRPDRETHGRGRAGPGVGGDALEVLRRVPERHAAIARAVLVPALEGLAGAAEHQRARRHQLAAGRRAVLEAARGDDGDGDARVLLLERAILRDRTCTRRRTPTSRRPGPGRGRSSRPARPLAARRARARSRSTAIFAKRSGSGDAV